MDLRDLHPGHTPRHGWNVSPPRHPDGWLAMWLDFINRDGAASYDTEAGVLTIERLDGQSLQWCIEVTEADLEAHLASFLDQEGTVYGLDDPDEPVETDSMIAALRLFMVHVEEDLVSNEGGNGEFRHELVPGTGLRPRPTHPHTSTSS